uniref:Uncharacterized protein n=1 Tax=Anguilla anguilla TaxID=7936 RepID=A0A0E9RJF1_ANGAN
MCKQIRMLLSHNSRLPNQKGLFLKTGKYIATKRGCG